VGLRFLFATMSISFVLQFCSRISLGICFAEAKYPKEVLTAATSSPKMYRKIIRYTNWSDDKNSLD
jgi:hypothetical protein